MDTEEVNDDRTRVLPNGIKNELSHHRVDRRLVTLVSWPQWGGEHHDPKGFRRIAGYEQKSGLGMV